MDHIWRDILEGKSDKDKLHTLRRLRDGMSWGSREHGIPQLSQTVLFLLKMIDELEK